MALLAGYVLSRWQFRGRLLLLQGTLLLHAFPAITLIIAVFFILRAVPLALWLPRIDRSLAAPVSALRRSSIVPRSWSGRGASRSGGMPAGSGRCPGRMER